MGHFLPFYPPNSPKNQNFEKMIKMAGDIIMLNMRNKNYDQKMYSSWDMLRNRQVDRRKKWHIEVGAPPNYSIRITLNKLLYGNEILKCCKIYQPFSQILSQKTVHDGSRLWTHYPLPPIIWLSKAKYIANPHQAPWYFLFLSVEHREVYHKVYLKAFQNHMSLPSLASYRN